MTAAFAPMTLEELQHLTPMQIPAISSTPLVSVLVANFNYGRYLNQTIESVLNQTYQNFELCICDDGSSDDSRDVITHYASLDKRIKSIFLPNGGMASALNAAHGLASGEIHTLLDSDDVWKPEKLAKIVKCFQSNQDTGLVVHPLTQMNGDFQTVIRPRWPLEPSHGWLGPKILTGEHFDIPPCSGLCFHRDVLARIFPLNIAFRSWADAVTREHAAILTKTALVDESLGLMRIHEKNLTTTKDPPSDLKTVSGLVKVYGAMLDERKAFVEKALEIEVSTEPWTYQGANWRLAEKLLLGQPIDEHLVSHIKRERERQIWRILFRLPHRLAVYILQNVWWKESGIKSVMKRSLFLR